MSYSYSHYKYLTLKTASCRGCVESLSLDNAPLPLTPSLAYNRKCDITAATTTIRIMLRLLYM